ncbi:MAG: hypothetical protein HYW49_13200, partial [Deltaproteobacteria bacterium]|nr:hypothetical protein [Deltaproteobacteria bacterium]
REIRALDWCLTGRLVRVNTQDKDALTVVENSRAEQVAIRVLGTGEVYVDQSLFAQMSEKSRAYLLIHETIHGYLGLDVARRNEKLRSIVKALSKVEAGSIATRASLRYALSSNKVEFTGNTDALDPFKDYVLYVLGGSARKRSVLESLHDVTAFLSTAAFSKSFAGALTDDDREVLTAFNPVSGFAAICKSADDGFVEKMFDGSKNLSSELAVAAVSALSDRSGLRSKVLSSGHFTAQIRDLIDRLSEARASIIEARIAAPSLLKFMSADPNGGDAVVNVLELSAMYSESDFASNAIADGLYVYARNLVASGNWAALDAVLTGNSRFYAAFSLDQVLGSIVRIDAPVPREKTYAIENLIRVKKQFWALFLQKLQAETGAENFAKFESMLDKSRLGI